MEIIPGVTPHSRAFLNSEASSEEGGEQFKQQGVMPQASALLGDPTGGGNLWSRLTVLSGILVILKETLCVSHPLNMLVSLAGAQSICFRAWREVSLPSREHLGIFKSDFNIITVHAYLT